MLPSSHAYHAQPCCLYGMHTMHYHAHHAAFETCFSCIDVPLHAACMSSDQQTRRLLMHHLDGNSQSSHLKYVVVSLLPISTDVLPTALRTIHPPSVTLGMSLKALLRRCTSCLLLPFTNRARQRAKAASLCTQQGLNGQRKHKTVLIMKNAGCPFCVDIMIA